MLPHAILRGDQLHDLVERLRRLQADARGVLQETTIVAMCERILPLAAQHRPLALHAGRQ